MNGFQYLHSNNIMHRDFKLANIFLDNDTCVIGDLGFAKEVESETGTRLGTPVYMAPEILNLQFGDTYSTKSDLWSIGIVFFQMLTNKLPYNGWMVGEKEFKRELLEKSGPNLKFPNDIDISDASKDLLRQLLTYDPTKRIEI